MFKFITSLWRKSSKKFPNDFSQVKAGDKFEVDDPDEARMQIAMAAAMTGKTVVASADWDEETGKGIVSSKIKFRKTKKLYEKVLI